jgi:hypothetical protein
MIIDTYLGVQVFLLNDAPNFRQSGAYQTDFAFVVDGQTSLTKRETRRPYSATLRVTVNQTHTISGDTLKDFVGAIRQLKAQPVLVPFWPAVSFWSSRASAKIKGGLMVAFKPDWSQHEIYADGDEPAWPVADDLAAPVLWGSIKSSEPKWIGPALERWAIEFAEASPAGMALFFDADDLPTGPTPTGYLSAPILLPFRPDHRSVSEKITVEVTKDTPAIRREAAGTFYPHEPWRSQDAQYVLSGSGAIANLLSFIEVVAGQGAPFWAVGALESGVLAADYASGAGAVTLTTAGSVLAGDHLAAVVGGSFISAKVFSVVGDVVNLSETFGAALPSGSAIYHMSLARLVGSRVTVRWPSPVIAVAKMSWQEVRPETVLPGDETLTDTIGQLKTRVVLFQFVRDYGNGTVVNYYATNFEKDLTYGGHTWVSGPWEMGEQNRTLNLEDDSCGFEFMITKPDGTLFATCPLLADVSADSEVPAGLKVWFADWDGSTVTNAVKQFDGEASKFSRRGNKVVADARVGSSLFETMLPLMVRGKICNHIKGSNFDRSFLISAGCTLLASDWHFTATVASPVSGEYPFELHVAGLARTTGAAPTFFADWFALGRVEWGAGANLQRRSILKSTVPASGNMVLTLNKFFSALPTVGDAVVIYPGCPGTYEACKAYDTTHNPLGKFGNGLNFGNNPLAPTSDPTLVGQQDIGMQGGKK